MSSIKIKSEYWFLFLERCVMRFLCSRSVDGELIDSMESLNQIFDRFKNRHDIARGIITLLKSMSTYGMRNFHCVSRFFLIH